MASRGGRLPFTVHERTTTPEMDPRMPARDPPGQAATTPTHGQPTLPLAAAEDPAALRHRLALASCGTLAEQELANEALRALAARSKELLAENTRKRLRIEELMTV